MNKRRKLFNVLVALNWRGWGSFDGGFWKSSGTDRTLV